jgi:hypothetical protein
MADLFSKQQKHPGQSNALGKLFQVIAARREHFLKVLAEKLKIQSSGRSKDFLQGRMKPS